MTIKGLQVQNNIKSVKKALDKDIEKAMTKSVIDVHKELVHILSGNRNGLQYPVPGTRPGERKGTSAGEGIKPRRTKWYRASAPGEPPAVRLGDLRTSYRWEVKMDGYIGEVGTPLDYGMYLEKGTKDIAPRPHLRPAFERSEKRIQKYFGDLL